MVWAELLNTGAVQGLLTVARPMLVSAVYQGYKEGMTGASMLRIMRSAGLGIRTQDFYSIMRAAKSFQGSSAESAASDLGSHISSHVFGGGIHSSHGQYNSVVTVHYTQTIDGEEVHMTKDIFIRSSQDMTVGQVVHKAYGVWGNLQQMERYPLGAPTAIEYIGTAA